MNFDKKILSEIISDYKQKKELKSKKLEQHKYAVYEKIPRIKEIDMILRSTAVNVIKIALENGSNPEDAINELKQNNLKLQSEKRALLQKNNIPHNFLDDVPDCKHCNDMGYLGTNPCQCLINEYQKRLKTRLSSMLPIKNQNFSNFNLDYYPESDFRSKFSPKKIMQLNLLDCQTYAQNFSTSSKNLLFYGSCGLGKTFLSTCIANAITQQGFSVAYDTTINLIKNYEAIKFGAINATNAAQSIQKYENADLLILDDLGAENISSLSISIIYSIINFRIMSTKPMIINTNIIPNDIEKKYSPAISSRILGEFTHFRFIGNDIRKIKNNM